MALVGYTANQWVNTNQLRVNGKTILARIVSHRTSVDAYDNINGYFVTYSFVVGSKEQTYTKEESVSASLYSDLQNAQNATVTYLPSNPDFSALSGTEAFNFDFDLLGAVTLVGLMTIITLLGVIGQRRYRRRVRQGVLVVGYITSSKSAEDSDNDLNVTIEYRFTAPETGQQLSKTMSHIRNDLKDKPLPPTGTPVLVFCQGPNRHFVL